MLKNGDVNSYQTACFLQSQRFGDHCSVFQLKLRLDEEYKKIVECNHIATNLTKKKDSISRVFVPSYGNS